MLSARRLSAGVVSWRMALTRCWIGAAIAFDRLLGIPRISSFEIFQPLVPSDPLAIGRLLRPIPDFERADVPGSVTPSIPPVGAVHRRILFSSIDVARVRVHRIDHGPPRIDVLAIAGDEQRVVESDQRARDAIPILTTTGHRIDRAESPAVRVLPPLTFGPPMRPSRSTKLGMTPPFCFMRSSQASM